MARRTDRVPRPRAARLDDARLGAKTTTEDQSCWTVCLSALVAGFASMQSSGGAAGSVVAAQAAVVAASHDAAVAAAAPPSPRSSWPPSRRRSSIAPTPNGPATGSPRLEVDESLMESARQHARWMTQNQTMRHTSAPVAENIAMGQQDSQQALASWMGSSGHRANILNPSHRRIGVAAFQTARRDLLVPAIPAVAAGPSPT